MKYPYENDEAIRQHIARQVYSKLNLLLQTADFIYDRTGRAPWEHLGIAAEDWHMKVVHPLGAYRKGPFPKETATLNEIFFWLGKYRINVLATCTPHPSDMQELLMEIEKDS